MGSAPGRGMITDLRYMSMPFGQAAAIGAWAGLHW